MRKVVTKYLIGIDEVGRGPLAGPVAVGVVIVPENFDWKFLPGVTDSKKLSPQKRQLIYIDAMKLKRSGKLDFVVTMVKAKTIDKTGIVPAITLALKRGLAKVEVRNKLVNIDKSLILVKLDGGLKAPQSYPRQETIIKGDAKEQVIGLASIVAKVTRDHFMDKLGLRPEYEAYGMLTHKGYGTRRHLEAIAEQGLTAEHRRSFCRRFVPTKLK
jgi:ribonuclease HII